MSETVVNLFAFIEGDLVKELGAVAYVHDGPDDQTIVAFLQKRVTQDLLSATRYHLPAQNIKLWLGIDVINGLPYEMYSYLVRTGNALRLFETVLQSVNASERPCVCITAIVDGKPKIEAKTHVEPTTNPSIVTMEFGGILSHTDYLAAYRTATGLDIHSLIHDDFTESIILLHSKKKYVSMMKLLLSFIDTVAFLEFGDIQDCFIKWVRSYAKIAAVGITELELWEFRNGLLHTTTQISRKVAEGKVTALSMYCGSALPGPTDSSGAKIFSIEILYETVIVALEKWSKSYSGNLPKQLEFIRRYDLIISEGRIAHLIPPSGDKTRSQPGK